MAPTFSGCAVVTHWLPHALDQFFFRLILELKNFWCYFSSLTIQTGVFVETFHITLLS